MSTASVIAVRQDLEAARDAAKQQLTPLDGVSIDNNTVFHVHCEAPKYPVYGTPVAVVLTRDKPASEESLKKQAAEVVDTFYKNIPHLCKGTERPVLFIVAHGDGGFSAQVVHEYGIVTQASISFIPEKAELFSRARGLLEVGLLSTKRAAIIGLGSGGSPVALDLARAGVGRFLLVDFDILELSNVARHVCDIRDLGRLKTNAIRDKILTINPYASIEILNADVTKDTAAIIEAVRGSDILIAATDNNKSRFVLNDVCLQTGVPGIFGRVITRAAGGDIVRVRPNHPNSRCLACVFKFVTLDEEVTSEAKAFQDAQPYTDPNEVRQTVQVGLYADITPITNMILKLALVELSSSSPTSGLKSLETDLEADFYMWANRRDANFANWSPMRYEMAKMTVLRWYGLKIQDSKDEGCMACGRGVKKASAADIALFG